MILVLLLLKYCGMSNFTFSINIPEHDHSQAAMTVTEPWIFATKPVAECLRCSTKIFSVRHPHITNLSSLRGQRRANILLGSSTLHNVWKSREFRGVKDFHHDIIIGGRVHDTHYSYNHHTEGWPGHSNIVIACGNNNIPTTDTDEDIKIQLCSLVCTIKRQNDYNKVVIASLLYAPKYCDKSLPASRNMLEKVRSVNKWIEEFNNDETGIQFDIGKYGVNGDPLKGDYIEHSYNDWKEPSIDRKLHLSDHVKNEIASELVDTFKKLNKIK